MEKAPTIITTWPWRTGDRFREVMNRHGISVLSFPMIEIRDLSFRLNRGLEAYDWVVFTSKNGIRAFLKQHSFSKANKIAVLGSGTASVLRDNGYEPDFEGSGQSGVLFARELNGVIGSGQNILLALGNLAPNRLNEALEPKNRVERVDVYETRKPNNIDKDILKRVMADNYSLIAVSSPSGIKNLAALTNDKLTRPLRVISIGETTSDAARRLGIEPLSTAREQSYEGMAVCALQTIKNM
ncbi:uroporphyrinogen-III synthase [Thermophagus sp. OGC60D27]|uniref:uroporphyrinogen-III synthase n=1 Tax=Thermophagus sp. OGC60D27 TaxID=3458415 RepID=UPI004037EE34